MSPELLSAIWGVVDPEVRRARQAGPLPSPASPRFLTAPASVQRAVLLVCGQARVLEDLAAADLVDTWLGLDYLDGLHHRTNPLPLISQLDRRRWPPHGDREQWVRHGPAIARSRENAA